LEDSRALEHLRRQGFECYLPLRQVERWRQGRRYMAEEPLFPRYVFVRFDEKRDRWYVIRSTRGVCKIIYREERLVAVRDDIVEEIRRRLALEPVKTPYLEPGQRVVVTDGCFAHVEAIFVANESDERVMLLMHILHREQTVSFPVQSVRKVRESRVLRGELAYRCHHRRVPLDQAGLVAQC
jgi:transcriptional antiterminator RfaH